jgi:hypothetical protein
MVYQYLCKLLSPILARLLRNRLKLFDLLEMHSIHDVCEGDARSWTSQLIVRIDKQLILVEPYHIDALIKSHYREHNLQFVLEGPRRKEFLHQFVDFVTFDSFVTAARWIIVLTFYDWVFK